MAIRVFGAVALIALLITACGGSPSASVADPIAPPPGTPTAAPVEASSAPTDAPVDATAPPTSAPVDATPGAGTSAIDVCSLLSPQDLSAATRNEYLEGVLDDYGQCYWDGNQIGGGTAGSTVIGAILAADLATIKGSFGEGGVDMTIDGHAAFYNPKQGLGSLWVDIGGGRLLVLSFPRSADLDPSFQAIAEQLAKAALANL